MSVASRRPLGLQTLTAAFLAIWLLAALFPFAWTVWGSFKVEADFFARQSWWMAIAGTRTQAQTGSAFTLAGYDGAWGKNEFWRAAHHDHRSGGDQPAFHPMDAAQLLPVDPQGS
ncbi:hypothetical protein MASR2M74_04410 [Paracoccaceae bacterium]